MHGTFVRASAVGAATLSTVLLGLAVPAARAAADRASCAVAPATIRATLGLSVASPRVQTFGPAVACLYFRGGTAANPVVVRVQTGESADAFHTGRVQLSAEGQPTTPLPALGGGAYASVVGFGNSVISCTVAVLRGGTELRVMAPAPLAKVVALTRAILASLGRSPGV